MKYGSQGSTRGRPAVARAWLGTLAAVSWGAWGAGCVDMPDETADAARVPLVIETGSATTEGTPVGLALEVENGVGIPVRVRAGQTFFINQIDIRTFVASTTDRGVEGLQYEGDFADLRWRGVHLQEEEPVLLPNPDGTFTRRRFFRGARWMERHSVLRVRQLDARGRPVSETLRLKLGREERRKRSDSFFVRRLRAIQWTYDCAGPRDCTGADDFVEEALVEARNAMHPRRDFRIHPRAATLELRWSLLHGRAWTIPLEQIEDPPYDYGFRIDVEPVTEAGPGGTYAPGTSIDFRLTLRDGAGNPLHPSGSLPTYNEVVFGPNQAGIQYYRAFFDPTTTYYRRKHRERMLMAQLVGPAHAIQPIRSIVDLDAFLGPDDTQVVGLPDRDGVYAEFMTVPPANDLFGGAFDPAHAGWDAPVSDVMTFHIPADAEPGTYRLTVKGRRTYLGEDVPRTTTIEIQVGTPVHGTAMVDTGRCASCHDGGGSLGLVLHANSDRAACGGCHVPLGFELEGPIAVRTHFIHSRTRRLDAPLDRCSICHLGPESIQRTSKAACLSCHDSYPATHVTWFGPIESIYIGGGRESFEQCTDSCHTTHPGSRF